MTDDKPPPLICPQCGRAIEAGACWMGSNNRLYCGVLYAARARGVVRV